MKHLTKSIGMFLILFTWLVSGVFGQVYKLEQDNNYLVSTDTTNDRLDFQYPLWNLKFAEQGNSIKFYGINDDKVGQYEYQFDSLVNSADTGFYVMDSLRAFLRPLSSPVYVAQDATEITPLTIFGEDLVFWFDNSYGVTESGGLVDSQTDRTGNATRTATGTNRPQYLSSNNIEYDGTNDYLTLDATTRNAILTDTQGFVLVVANILNNSSNKYFMSGDDGLTTNYLYLAKQGNGAGTAPDKQAMLRNVGGPVTHVQSDATITAEINSFGYSSNGSRYKMYYNEVEGTVSGGSDDGNWFGDYGALTAVRFGSVGIVAAFSSFKEYHILYVNREPTSEELSQLFNWL